MIDQDARWQELQDALAVGDAEAFDLDVDERAERQWREELDFYAQLAESAQADADEAATDAAIIDAALAAVPVESKPTSRASTGWVAALVVVAAVVALWVFVPRGVELRGADGTWATEAGDTVATGELIPSGTWLRVNDEACMVHGDAELCAEAQSRLQVRDANAHALELDEGAVYVKAGTWSVVSAGEVHMLTAGDRLEAKQELLAEAEAPAVEPTPEPVPEPVAAADDSGGEAEPAVAKPRTVRPRADAATLVARARKARGEGRLGDAEKSYAELLRRFPRSSEAEAGRYALAQIKLGRGKTKAALKLFTTVARGGGALAEDAAWGRIQALDKLGRKAELRKAVDAFVAKYPTSVYRARAQGRLDP